MKTPLQTLAGRFGLSQQQLAGFLLVHRSMISHINMGTKAFPAEYLVRLQQLLALDVASSKATKKAIKKLVNKEMHPHTQQHIQSIITGLEIKLRMAKKQLDGQRRLWSQYIKTVGFCTLVKEHALELNDKQWRWLLELQYQNEQQAAKCNPDDQLLLVLQIQAIKAQLYIYRKQTVIKNQINNL